MDAFARELAEAVRVSDELANRKVTVRELAAEWIEWLAEVRGAKPSTVRGLVRPGGEPG
jgi:hypothetical protein